jgi:hypothetical protein
MSEAIAGTCQGTAKRPGLAGHLSTARTLLAFWLIIVSAAQGVIAQGHVHFSFPQSTAASAAFGYSSATPDDRDVPADRASRDLSTCTLCQSLAGGAAPLGLALRYVSLLATFGCIVVSDSANPDFVSAVSHIWTSRGPPSA